MIRTTLAIASALTLVSSTRAAPFPGGMLDAGGRTAIVRTPTGLVAIDLSDGRAVWRTAEANRPLFAVGDRVYAAALTATNEFRLVGFDARGRRVFRSAAIELPRWASSADQPGGEFAFTWTREGTMLTVTWTASARAALGPAKEAFGRARIDLRNGQVQALAGPRPVAPPEDRPPAVLDRRVVRWRHPIGLDMHAVTLEAVPGGGERLVLRTWDARSWRPGFERELMRGARLDLMAGLDATTLWLRDGMAPRDDESQGQWTLVSAADGHRVARVPYRPGLREVLVTGSRAYGLTTGSARPLAGGGRGAGSVVAIDLETGRTLWERPLGER